MFRRKTRHSNLSNDSYNIGTPETTEINTTPLEQRSCSTSKLVEENGVSTGIGAGDVPQACRAER